jgi:glutamate synthase (NADPH/NADH) large chain
MRTLVYKGMVTTLQLEPFFPDLSEPEFESQLALVHSRFSTNTFPSWPLAHPFRFIAHNGEINTVKGNANWMRARESQLESDQLGDIEQLKPIVTAGASDSATFDEVLELLVLSGRSLPHAMMMMIPGAWEKQLDLEPQLRDFFEYHSMIMEPWDGPAAVIFTDGTLVGATLDRNGLRPGRFVVTEDGFIILASEIGVANIPAEKIVRKGREEDWTDIDNRKAVESNDEMALYFVLPTRLPNRKALEFHKTACLIWRMAGGAEPDEEYCSDDDDLALVDTAALKRRFKVQGSAGTLVELQL